MQHHESIAQRWPAGARPGVGRDPGGVVSSFMQSKANFFGGANTISAVGIRGYLFGVRMWAREAKPILEQAGDGRREAGGGTTDDRGRATLHEIRATSHEAARQIKPISWFVSWKRGCGDEDRANQSQFSGVGAGTPAAWEVGQRRLELGRASRYDGWSAWRGPFAVRRPDGTIAVPWDTSTSKGR